MPLRVHDSSMATIDASASLSSEAAPRQSRAARQRVGSPRPTGSMAPTIRDPSARVARGSITYLRGGREREPRETAGLAAPVTARQPNGAGGAAGGGALA